MLYSTIIFHTKEYIQKRLAKLIAFCEPFIFLVKYKLFDIMQRRKSDEQNIEKTGTFA
jgi:hypothetical protein